MGTLTDRVLSFCRQFPGAEEIDAIILSDAQKALKLQKADFFFENRSIICEIKTLEQDPQPKLERAMADHGIHPSGLSAGEHVVEELFRRLPKGLNLYRRMVKDVTRRIDKDLDSATCQIRDTKKLFGLPSADGLVIVLNENVHILGHRLFEERLRLTLGKTTRGGEPYHSDITYVLLFIEALAIAVGGGELNTVNTYYDNPPVPDRHDARKLIHRLAESWASYNGKSFTTADGDERLHELMTTSKLAVYVR